MKLTVRGCEKRATFSDRSEPFGDAVAIPRSGLRKFILVDRMQRETGFLHSTWVVGDLKFAEFGIGGIWKGRV